MHYDIAAKRLMELGGTAILRELAGLDVRDLTTLDELPQEVTSLLHCDYAARCTDSSGAEAIVIVEFQTRWSEEKLLDLAAYTALRMRRHRLPVRPIMLLFQAHPSARDAWQEGALTLHFNLIRVWEIDSDRLLESPNPWLWALSPLTHDGIAKASKVDTMIHEAEISRTVKSDLLTTFAIFLSLRNADLSREIIQRRRDIMIESPFYEVIKTEGREEGRAEGLAAGLRTSLLDALEAVCGGATPALTEEILKTTDETTLRAWFRIALRCHSLPEFEQRRKASL